MSSTTYGVPGGAQKTGVTTSTVAVDLTALAGIEVDIWSDDQDLLIGWSADGTGTLVYTGDLAASKTALKARRVAKGYPARRKVWLRYPYLLVAAVTGTALVHVAAASIDSGDV